MIAALYGTLMMLTDMTNMAHWSTHIAAVIRSSGMTIFSYMNHSPTVSERRIRVRAIKECMINAVLNVSDKALVSFFAKSKFK
ncbi:hypothetical protein PC1C4_09850 [Paraprevotella clara]|nr:hypothetical protein PC1C4_09850 [Paraprevotella clara]